MCYPTKTRETFEAMEKFYLFGGRTGDKSENIQRFYSDTEKSLVKTARLLGITHRQSQPGEHKTSTMAERCNRDVEAGAKCILAQAGLPDCFWPFAAPYYCLMENLTYDSEGVRLYNKWAGQDFDAKIIPFGALVDFIPPDSRQKEKPDKWAASFVPGIFWDTSWANLVVGTRSTWWLL